MPHVHKTRRKRVRIVGDERKKTRRLWGTNTRHVTRKGGAVAQPGHTSPSPAAAAFAHTTQNLISNKAKEFGSKLIDEAVDVAAEFVGIELTPDEKNELDRKLTDVVDTFEPNVEKGVLDAVGVIPGIGEAVEGARLIGDLVQSGENIMNKGGELEDIANLLSTNSKLHEKLLAHHEFQQKILDRVNKSKEQFAKGPHGQKLAAVAAVANTLNNSESRLVSHTNPSSTK